MVRGSIADLALSYGLCGTNRASWADVLGSIGLYSPSLSFLTQIWLLELMWKSHPFLVTEPSEHLTKALLPAPSSGISFHLCSLQLCPAKRPSPYLV